MKHIFTLFLCLASVFSMNAQSVSLFDVDASGFPTVKAKFYAFDAANKQQRPSKSELTITENGQPRTITSVTCPPDTIKSLSVCIMVDTYGYGLIKLAQAGTQRLINYLLPPKDEIAITIMNKGVQIHQDFTSDTAKASMSASNIPPAPGYVDVQKMFYYPYTGGVSFISGRTSDKKVLILVSDLHCPNLNLDTVRLYQDAAQHNISVYAVLLGTTDYSGLFKRVAEKTGGKVFETVKTETQISNIFKEIERLEHYIPCDITWEDEFACQLGNTVVDFSWQLHKSQTSYRPPVGEIASLQVTPNITYFGKRTEAIIHDTTITLTATKADFTVTGITHKYGSTDFSVVNPSFPLTIAINTSATITLRFAPSDSSTKYASFEITTDKCLVSFSVSGGFPFKKMGTSTLKLTKPNGGEIFTVGSDTVITWEGVAPSDTVTLEYSSDNGVTWQLLTKEATDLHHEWKRVPRPPSEQCLVRSRQKGTSTGNTLFRTLAGHGNEVESISFSPDGSRIATASRATVNIWDVKTGTILRSFFEQNSEVTGLAFSPDGSRIAISLLDYIAKVRDAITGTIIQTFSGHTSYVTGIAYSPDGSRIATASSDKTAKVWDVQTGAVIQTFSGHTNVITQVAFSPDGSRIATASIDSTAKVWDAITGTIIQTFSGHTAYLTSVAYSPVGNRIATSSLDGTIKVWDVLTGKVIHTFSGHFGSVLDVAFSPDGSLIVTASTDMTAKLWDTKTGEVIHTFSGHTSYVMGVVFCSDGSRIATASSDKTAKIWEVDAPPIQEDTSDAVFSIIAPEPTLQNLSIDMGKVLVGQSKDSTVLGVICNKGSAPLHVLGIDITSGDATDFTIPRGAGDFFLDSNECRDVMFGFAPTKVGMRRAQATIRTTVGDFIDTISIIGEGIAPALAIVTPFIDFGKTLVGTPKDTSKVVTIKNVGTSELTITQTDYNAVNTTNFSTINGGNSFTLQPNMEAIMDLRFLPFDVGRRSGILQFHYNGVGSPATVQLFGEGIINIPDTARTTVIAQDITAQAGEKVNLMLKLFKPSGMHAIGAPTDWYARIHYNKSILFNEQTSNVCPGTTDSCVLELTGVYNPKTDELISIPCIATLGNTDHSSIVIEEFKWLNSNIATDVATQNGTITISGVCEDGGVRLFIPAKSSTSLSSRPNPVQDKLQIQYGLREPLTVTLELLTMTGQVVQTIVNNQTQAIGQYTLTSDMSVLGNGVYLLRLKTNKEMLTTRVDVVK